ncbi:MAG: hypothetical protein J6Y95_05370, partial [Lachnospiraceae bacterium]|nr:hypothetical protein [Lachnospiraceae bacterium]
MVYLKNNMLECGFDEETGMLREILHGGMRIRINGLDFDFGADERMVNGLFAYESMLDFRTWNLPRVSPTGKAFGLKPIRFLKEEDRLTAVYESGPAEVSMRAKLLPEALEVSVLLTNTTDKPVYLNTLAFRLSLPDASGISFEFPGSAPIGRFELKDMKPLQPVEGGLVNFATRIRLPEGGINFLFIDPVEKWASAGYRDDESAYVVYDAALEADLAPGESLEVGSLYLLLTAKASENYAGDGSPYLQIRRFVESLGFQPAEGGIRDGVMYSCHPSGTMDAGFPFKTDLFEYAKELPKLREMGIDHVWLLPVFEHDENGVYHSTDQSVIDPRYGGEEGCRYFCEKAHDLGMTVLFDYVPHGPAADFPLVKAHPDWPSKKRDGSMQEEWECVSMDYNHPGYQEYTTELVEDHVRRFSIDGARIDCAMGGLSNWRPYPGNRPSGNSVLAGVHIT